MKHIAVLFLILLNWNGLLAQSQVDNYARSILDTLCGSAMGGRGYVNSGELMAAEFIAAEFKTLQLDHFDTSFFQKFSITANTLPGTVKLSIGKQELEPGKDFLVDADAPTLTGNFPVIPLSRATVEDQITFSMMVTQTPASILLIDEAEFDLSKNEDRQMLDELLAFLKCFDHPRIKAKAIILLSENPLKWSPSPVQCLRPLFRVKKEVFPEKAKRASFEIESNYIEEQNSQNVIACIKGKTSPDSMIVVTAHYDHLGKMGETVYFPGANDNASGIAMMLSLAKHFQTPGNKPDKTIVFIAFGSEEIGLRGSYYFTENPLFPLENINFLINLDILGTGDDGIQVVNGTIFNKEFDQLSDLNTKSRLLKAVKIRGEMCKSDHCFFHQKGVPNFYIYTLGGVAHYHDIFDHPDTLPLTEFEDLKELLIAFIEKLNLSL
ncbi:MAG: M20/M25/M40 family metallo-hydrolase [Bacteroidota bacterium]